MAMSAAARVITPFATSKSPRKGSGIGSRAERRECPFCSRLSPMKGRLGSEAKVADIFIAHSRLDEDRALPVAERLISLGYSVARAEKGAVSEAELDAARAVLVLWSRNARNSAWVCAEAAYALDQGKLLQAHLDPLAAPTPFNAMATADLAGERGEWGALEDRLSRLVRGVGEKIEAPAVRSAPIWAAGSPGLSLAALAAALAVHAGAFSAALSGAMTPAQVQVALWGALAIACLCAILASLRLAAALRAGS